MKLEPATKADIRGLMSWFPDQPSIGIWGGPNFRYPFTPRTFEQDTHWQELDSFCLVDSEGDMLGFGQIYERCGRINLARLVVAPESRGKGFGKQLVRMLMDEGKKKFPLTEFSLFVYEHNRPADACYRSLGFEKREWPSGEELIDNCVYMTCPV